MNKSLYPNLALAISLLASIPALAQQPTFFTPGNLVVVVEGCGLHNGACTSVPNGTGNGTGNSSVGGYGDNQASPLTLFQFTPAGAFVNSLVLPQSGSGANLAVSSEYGSSSEGTIHLSAVGHYLTVMGYGIDVNTFNATPAQFGAAPSNALAQSGSLTGQSYTPVSRVVALVDANGNVNSSTALFNVFNTNNPRSIFTANGSTAYVSGQGAGNDATSGIFFTPLGGVNNAPTPITGLDTTNNTVSQDTRDVQIVSNTLYASVDTKGGSNSARSYIGTLGAAGNPPTTAVGGPVMLNGVGNSGGTGKVTITTGPNSNGNPFNAGLQINISPSNFFFANASTLYVADTGNPKNNSANSTLGNGGLEKWINTKSDGSGTWNLAYTLYRNLNLVQNTASSGTSGLYGLAGAVNGNSVQLFATNATLADLDPTFLYSITDTLSFTTASQALAETFTQLAAAPADSNFKGVSFAPTIPAGAVEITSSPSGLAFTSTGTGCAQGTYTAPQTLLWTPGSNCALSVLSPQNGSTGTEYALAQWEDGSTGTTHTVTAPQSTATYNASFTTEFQLTTAAGSGGAVTPGGFFPQGTGASVTATPNSGFYFVNFTGTITSSDNPLSLTMNGPQAETANFAPQTTPTITWPAPAAITYGSALSSTQLDASASVPGTFIYNPPAGTVLPVGTNEALSVAFTPTDTTHYTAATGGTAITVNSAGGSGPANLVVTKALTRTGGNVVVTLTIANTGGTAASNVTLTTGKVGSTAGSPLPQSVGTINPGDSVQLTLSVPGTVGAPGAASTLTIGGTYTGGTFSSTARITLP